MRYCAILLTTLTWRGFPRRSDTCARGQSRQSGSHSCSCGSRSWTDAQVFGRRQRRVGRAADTKPSTWVAAPFDSAVADETGTVTFYHPGEIRVGAIIDGKPGFAIVTVKRVPPLAWPWRSFHANRRWGRCHARSNRDRARWNSARRCDRDLDLRITGGCHGRCQRIRHRSGARESSHPRVSQGRPRAPPVQSFAATSPPSPSSRARRRPGPATSYGSARRFPSIQAHRRPSDGRSPEQAPPSMPTADSWPSGPAPTS